jgi:type II secretory pathway pseudopilin PulG
MTLVEVLIAMAIMALVSMAVVAGLSSALVYSQMHSGKVTAEALARTQLEIIKSDNYTSLAPGFTVVVDDTAGFTINKTIERYDPNTGGSTSSDTGILRVTVNVFSTNNTSYSGYNGNTVKVYENITITELKLK